MYDMCIGAHTHARTHTHTYTHTHTHTHTQTHTHTNTHCTYIQINIASIIIICKALCIAVTVHIVSYVY